MTEIMITQVFNGFIIREVVGQQLKQAFIANDLNEVLEIVGNLYKRPQPGQMVPVDELPDGAGVFAEEARTVTVPPQFPRKRKQNS